MEDCVFCKIIKGEIPCHKIYEDDKFLAFLDINPFTEGHTLLVPKKHYRWVYDISEFEEFWQIAKKIALAIKKSKIDPDFISFLTVGEDVAHAHIHIIPRKNGDSFKQGLSSIHHQHFSEDDFSQISNFIKNSL